METTKELNPRYVAYSESHGKNPESMLEADRKKYPGGCMCGFILWINKKSREFGELHPEKVCNQSICDHAAFTDFLFKE